MHLEFSPIVVELLVRIFDSDAFAMVTAFTI